METFPKVPGYDAIKFIGRGCFGNCYKVKRKRDNKILAMKQIQFNGEMDKTKVTQEIDLLYTFDSPYILKYYDNIINERKHTIYIFTEFCAYGNLENVIKAARSRNGYLSEEYVWKIFCQLTLALHLCHGLNVIHRDIKPDNVFLNANRDAVLGDFGVARVMSAYTQAAFTATGAQAYRAPEIWANQGYTTKADVWSLGCLIYELSCLLRPYDDVIGPLIIHPFKILKAIERGQLKPIPADYSKLLQSTIKRLLDPKPSTRPAIKELINSSSLASKYKMLTKAQDNANYLAKK